MQKIYRKSKKIKDIKITIKKGVVVGPKGREDPTLALWGQVQAPSESPTHHAGARSRPLSAHEGAGS